MGASPPLFGKVFTSAPWAPRDGPDRRAASRARHPPGSRAGHRRVDSPQRGPTGYRGPMWQEDEDLALQKLSRAEDTDELCRLLLESSWRWRSSSHSAEAVDLLRKVRGKGTFPGAFCAL